MTTTASTTASTAAVPRTRTAGPTAAGALKNNTSPPTTTTTTHGQGGLLLLLPLLLTLLRLLLLPAATPSAPGSLHPHRHFSSPTAAAAVALCLTVSLPAVAVAADDSPAAAAPVQDTASSSAGEQAPVRLNFDNVPPPAADLELRVVQGGGPPPSTGPEWEGDKIKVNGKTYKKNFWHKDTVMSGERGSVNVVGVAGDKVVKLRKDGRVYREDADAVPAYKAVGQYVDHEGRAIVQKRQRGQTLGEYLRKQQEKHPGVEINVKPVFDAAVKQQEAAGFRHRDPNTGNIIVDRKGKFKTMVDWDSAVRIDPSTNGKITGTDLDEDLAHFISQCQYDHRNVELHRRAGGAGGGGGRTGRVQAGEEGKGRREDGGCGRGGGEEEGRRRGR
ncbi:hypothetical protein DFJ73DRAFT_966017 [Zopfochytrium polystomum]|nr:hypothetical protein DFJ73DRAFT_966017 [Zopfochytrium polystomum]